MSHSSMEFLYPVSTVNGAEAEAEWERLKHAGKSEGFTPVILGTPGEIARILETMSFNEETVEEILQKAESISAEEWLKTKTGEMEDDEDVESQGGEDPIAPSHLTVPFEVLTGRPHEEVVIARIPTLNSWEIPAYLKAGGWNECPLPEEQVAISKYWHHKYGAQLACLSGDIVEYVVSNPPEEKHAADELAREQYAYCGDIVWQGVESIANLSKTLLGSKYWYFWWD